ncbi:alcohol acetyltransferase [Leucobacter sp. UCMA 4100]|uniref:alcohol acetyltransferase n=1 Tax=Leucobacter sp. UCMA 4100 TaxID=2810534 RepID=UPI0022EAC563|nr:alcohol acetyltransferase [Leucobacter sp. UCMA 4100]MDA3146883.1 alcohol acetyltransferase [Leucobacter sp. UCMA 4100]
MNRRAWVRLDNASNIFLAARSDVDPKVFRVSAEVDHEVDPELLQRALDTTFDRYPLYHSVLRSGIFWYYLQDSDLRPRVRPESQHTCAPIYFDDKRALLFRVIYHRKRIMLEIFHALSDGTGALWFLSDLVEEYVWLRSPEAAGTPGGPKLEIDQGWGSPVARGIPAPEPMHELVADSFSEHFAGKRAAGDEPKPQSGDGAARYALREAKGALRPKGGRVYRVRGTRTPDNRTRLVELTAPAGEVIALAKAEGVSLTMYLTALLLDSVNRASGGLGKARTMGVSIPVNLRQHFPSTSARNFFATVRVEHRFGEGLDDIGSICRDLDEQFRPQATREALEAKVQKLIAFERMALLRIVPRALKNVILRQINRANNRGLTVALSNLGNVRLPGQAEAHVGRMLFHVASVRPQFCAMSHAGELTISFTSPFVETDHVREFARRLTEAGVHVTVAATRVTEQELDEQQRAVVAP